MSLNPDIRDRAYQFFIEEARELLQVLEKGLLELRQDHSTSKVHELMRAAHSIKGGAASVELSAIELLAHRLEDFFKALYSDSVEFDEELEGLLLQGYDCLSHPLTEQIEAGTFDEEAALLAAEPVFAALSERLADALANADNYIPSANDLGVDIVASIFEVDVARGLEHLARVLANPASYDPATELKGQLEMFAGFGELFSLSGFSEIIETAQLALERHPQQVLTIVEATIAECTQARERVLAGDRQQGGEVSAALRELASASAVGEAKDDRSAILQIEDIFNNIADDSQPTSLDLEQSDRPELEEVDIWSAVSEFEPVAEDIFSSIADDSPTVSVADDFTQLFAEAIEEAPEATAHSSSWGEIELESNDLIDFSVIPDEQTAAELSLTLQEISAESDRDDIDRVFQTVSLEQPTPENIAAAISSIEDIFAELPSAASEPASLLFDPPTASQPSPASSSPAKQVNTAPKLSVRVDLERLERMNNLVGELTINRNGLALQNERLQESVSELEQKFFRFRAVTKKIREMSDRMLLQQPTSSLPSLKESIAPSTSSMLETEFDTLELDKYNLLYSSLQEAIEEIVRLEESVEDITIFAKQSNSTIDNQRQMLGQLRDELMWVRMLPLDEILQRFPRTLRDLSHKYRKPVELQLLGTDVLVERAVLEKLSDPLLHLLRNGFDHGIEDPETRRQQGKPAKGSIAIQAYYQGDRTMIEVRDDGRGLNLDKIKRKGIERGLISEQEANTASPERLFELIFEPGFSTASQVSEISGRGVGMNIVRSQIEALKGKISVTSTPGAGSTFTLQLPLTLTIAQLLVCSLGATAFALPSNSIEEIIIPTPEQIKIAGDRQFLVLDRELIPIYSLKKHLTYNCPLVAENSSSQAFKTIAVPEDWSAPLLSIRRGQQLFALEVASLLSEQELVIKPYGKAIAAPAYSYGCTILGDGSLIPVFDAAAILRTILGEPVLPVSRTEIVTEAAESILTEETSEELERDEETKNSKPTLKTILVVDDSTALRRTMALTLEKAGYRVIQKKNGREALNVFQENPNLDLIVCDIEMPVMNGFEFLGMRRRDSALSRVPTFMLTSRTGAKHRNLATQLGADGYFTKPFVEQEFLREIEQILTDTNRDDGDRDIPLAIATQTILIIDDSSALRRTLALSLENKGYRVLQGRDGVEGLRLLQENSQIDLIICDVEMPNMNGFEFLSERRKEPKQAEIPVIMLTSRGSDKHRALANSLGASGFYTKPYVEEQFLREIEQYLS